MVTTAHHTRLLTAQREQLVLERDALDIEWRNLILEENALGDHSRVERIATGEVTDATRRSITRKYRCTEIRIIATDESSAKNA
ncbi:cell division protein FtsL [Klebsiella pneumoniae]|uniref:Cell division protein FtsL n=1 Tax=Klebsiella pneumoniae TaxID=573 RepID=A0A2X3GRM4_KLEPN|nr:cell division protein FtsL [Klebsiella pneumoniae]